MGSFLLDFFLRLHFLSFYRPFLDKVHHLGKKRLSSPIVGLSTPKLRLYQRTCTKTLLSSYTNKLYLHCLIEPLIRRKLLLLMYVCVFCVPSEIHPACQQKLSKYKLKLNIILIFISAIALVTHLLKVC